jgi:hypothetical protein
MSDYSVVLRELRNQRDRLDAAITALEGLTGQPKPTRSAAARARIAAAQRVRWAKTKHTTARQRRVLSAVARKRIVAAQKARWAKWRANHK